MKNLKIRMLSLGVLSSIIISSTPVFAKTNSSTENKIVTTASASKEKKIVLKGSWDGQTVAEILDGGGVIEYGDEGKAVRQVQSALMGLGYFAIEKIDGEFGSETRAAVKSFQRHENLTVDGKIGKRTWNKMLYLLDQD